MNKIRKGKMKKAIMNVTALNKELRGTRTILLPKVVTIIDLKLRLLFEPNEESAKRKV